MRDGFSSTRSIHFESIVALAVMLDDPKQSHFGLLSFIETNSKTDLQLFFQAY